MRSARKSIGNRLVGTTLMLALLAVSVPSAAVCCLDRCHADDAVAEIASAQCDCTLRGALPDEDAVTITSVTDPVAIARAWRPAVATVDPSASGDPIPVPTCLKPPSTATTVLLI